jgi:hypothetical protein
MNLTGSCNGKLIIRWLRVRNQGFAVTLMGVGMKITAVIACKQSYTVDLRQCGAGASKRRQTWRSMKCCCGLRRW